jgi:hypothetical protein
MQKLRVYLYVLMRAVSIIGIAPCKVTGVKRVLCPAFQAPGRAIELSSPHPPVRSER